MGQAACKAVSYTTIPTCSINPGTAVTCSSGHFNHVVFAVMRTGRGRKFLKSIVWRKRENQCVLE